MKDKSTLLNEIRVHLSEKRTSLSVLRTGLALFTVPVSVFTILTAASQYYTLSDVLFLFVFLVAICISLILLGSYLIVRSVRRIHKIDSIVKELKDTYANVESSGS